MAKFGSLSAPVTNDQASKRFQDTQALRARQLAGATPAGQVPQAMAQAGQVGAQLTADTAGQNLQQQQTQQKQGAQMGQLQLGQQRMEAQQAGFDDQMATKKYQQDIDQRLFARNQEAADEEQRMRNEFSARTAQNNYLQEIEMQDWVVKNAKDEQDFQDKWQMMEQAHSRKARMVNHAYAVAQQQLEQEYKQAHQKDKQRIREEMALIRKSQAEAQAKAKADAANRAARKGAMGTILSVGVTAAATPFLGPAAPLAGAAAGALFNEFG